MLIVGRSLALRLQIFSDGTYTKYCIPSHQSWIRLGMGEWKDMMRIGMGGEVTYGLAMTDERGDETGGRNRSAVCDTAELLGASVRNS
jgi:hypothetical protein